jgi:hypothetical protein
MNSIVRAIAGALAGAALAWLSCGTTSYLIDPNPEMVHPFLFAANLGTMIGAPIGFLGGLFYAVLYESPKLPSN